MVPDAMRKIRIVPLEGVADVGYAPVVPSTTRWRP